MLDKNDLNKIEEIIESKNFATNKDLKNLENRMDARFEKIDERFEKIDERFEKIDARFEKIDDRFDDIELKLAEQMTYIGQTLHSFRTDIKEDMKQILGTLSEDIMAVNDDVQKNKKRIDVLEITVKKLQMKTV